MRKKICIGVCLGLMALSVTACGQKDTNSSKTTDNKTAETKANDETVADGTIKELTLFSVTYPEEWNFDEENITDEESSGRIQFFLGDTLDEAEKKVTIYAQKEETLAFGKALIKKGIDLKDYADGKAKTLKYGDVDYTVSSSEYSDDTVLTYRHPQSGVTYEITVKGDKEDAAIKALLKGIKLNLSDEGNVEAPWPWEGKPFEPTLAEQMVGKFTIKPEYVPFEESNAVMDIMAHQFVQYKDKLYCLYKNKLSTYKYDTKGLKLETSLDLEDDYEFLSYDKSGMLYLSQGIFEVIGVKDGKKALQTEVKGDLVMDISGKWGITSWVNSDTQIVHAKDGVLTAKPWILTGLNDDENRKGIFNMISEVAITDSFILVAGNTAGEDTHFKIQVYDHDGNEKMLLGGEDISDPDCLGSITGMAETKNGIVATDGNMRTILFWKKDGTFIGSIKVKDLFGTDYPWLEDMQLLEDGSILVQLTQRREDKSSDELMFYRLTGF
jgi:hypothetical protein